MIERCPTGPSPFTHLGGEKGGGKKEGKGGKKEGKRREREENLKISFAYIWVYSSTFGISKK